MSPANLEQQGKLDEFPAVELFQQAAQDSLSGTFRLARETQKIAVYFDAGVIVYAASNLRANRLSNQLAQLNLLNVQDLTEFQSLSDFELGAKLIELEKLTPTALAAAQNRQVSGIVAHALAWLEGDFQFSPMVRLKEDLRVTVKLPELLLLAARAMPDETILPRLNNNSFEPETGAMTDFDLQPVEAFVLSRIDQKYAAGELSGVVGLPENQTLKIIYSLWLGGLLRRFDYDKFWNDEQIRQLNTAKFAVRANAAAPSSTVEAVPVTPKIETPVEIAVEPSAVAVPEIVDEKVAVAAFFERVAAAKTHYQVLNVQNTATGAEIKSAYFKLAKQFHPDKFYHTLDAAAQVELQNAFSRLAGAYDAIRDAYARELYDYKLSKTAGQEQKGEISEQTPEMIFEQGMKELNANNYNQAIAFLTRAVQIAPKVSKYHARLGQALATNPKFRHRAEAELQLAVKLDEKNSDLRLMLAEFYQVINLPRRCENELRKLLSIDPSHQAAQQLLKRL